MEPTFRNQRSEDPTVNPSIDRRKGRFSDLRARWLLGLGLLALAGCHLPNFKGAQLQEALPGFRRVPGAAQGRKMFPAWEAVHYDVWVNMAWGELSTIHINGYPGTLMRADVQAALEDAIASVTEPVTFSGVQEMTIDGQTAWGWAEHLRTDEGLIWIAYRVAIPYDTITYTLDLHSGDPALKSNSDTLLAIASSFAIGKVVWDIPLILGIGAVLIILFSTARRRARQKAIRLQSITLMKVEIEKEEGEKEGAETDDDPETP
jgi:hypothetical protein